MIWDFGFSDIPPVPDRSTRILFLVALILAAASVLAAFAAAGVIR